MQADTAKEIACYKCGCYYGEDSLGELCGDQPRFGDQCRGTVVLLDAGAAEAINLKSHRTRWRRR